MKKQKKKIQKCKIQINNIWKKLKQKFQKKNIFKS